MCLAAFKRQAGFDAGKVRGNGEFFAGAAGERHRSARGFDRQLLQVDRAVLDDDRRRVGEFQRDFLRRCREGLQIDRRAAGSAVQIAARAERGGVIGAVEGEIRPVALLLEAEIDAGKAVAALLHFLDRHRTLDCERLRDRRW